jgi:hypothetical protein
MPKQLPNIPTQAERLRWARESAGFKSPREAARKFEWNENTYKSHENGVRGTRGLPEAAMKRYGRAFGVAWEWIAVGSSDVADRLRLTRIWDRIPAHQKATAERVLEGFAEPERETFKHEPAKKRRE